MESSPLSVRAHAALALANHEPGRAVRGAAAIVTEASLVGAWPEAAVGELAWGHALLATGDAATALQHLRRAMTLAARYDLDEVRGEAAIKLAFAQMQQGRTGQSLRTLDTILPQLDGLMRGRALSQRAVNLQMLGELERSAEVFRDALTLVRAADEPIALQRLLTNFGILLTELHDFAAADTVFAEADAIARHLGRTYSVGVITENRAYAASLQGDVPRALELLEDAGRIVESLDGNLAPLYQDRAELLLAAGLATEARAWAERAVAENVSMHRHLKASEVRLVAAQAALAMGDAQTAVREAGLAAAEFGRQRRPTWVAQARLVVVRAHLAGARSTLPWAQVVDTVETLAASGQPADAVEAWVSAARLRSGRAVAGQRRSWLEQAAAYARRSMPAAVRARGWFALALLRIDDGRPTAARSALRAGLGTLDLHSDTIVASDLRARSTAARAEIAGTGVRLAMTDSRPASILEWVERAKANRLRRAVRPPDDPALTGLLAELRTMSARAQDSPTRTHAASVAGIEAAIRDRYRMLAGTVRTTNGSEILDDSRPPRTADLRAALGHRKLLDFFDLDGTLHVVVVDRARCRVIRVAPTETVAGLVDRLTFALRRLAAGGLAAPSRAVARQLLAGTADRLDALVGSAVGPDVEEFVVCPTGPLHDLPWSLLPSFAGRPVTVAPSASVWSRRPTPARALGSKTLVVAGPQLPGAAAEAIAVSAIHGVTPLLDAAAAADRVLAELGRTDLLHLSAHGRLSAENPLFSSVLLGDGPLMVYDLETVPRVPDTVVLASCDTARNQVCTGDELLGLAATLLRQGCSRLIAPVVPVPDHSTEPVMTMLHRRLAEGLDPVVALARTQDLVSDDESLSSVAASFVCLGVNREPRRFDAPIEGHPRSVSPTGARKERTT